MVRGAALGLLVLVLSVLLREAGFRGARLISLVGAVLLMGLAVLKMQDIPLQLCRNPIGTIPSHSRNSASLVLPFWCREEI